MITFKAVVPDRRKADGTYGVKIRLTFKRKSRYLPTNIRVTAADITHGRKIKNSGVLAATNAACDEYRRLVGTLSPFTVEAWDVDDVLKWIRREQSKARFELDFLQYGETVADRQTPSVGKQTRTALNAFSRFLDGKPCDINDITVQQLQQFVSFVEKEPKRVGWKKTARKASKIMKRPGVTAKTHITRLAAVYRAARDQYNDEDAGIVRIPREPFSRVKVKSAPHTGQPNLGPKVVQRIISAPAKSRAERRALDAFVVSFALMGANVADLWDAAPPGPDGVWRYERKKTRKRRSDRARMEVRVPACLAPYIDRLRDPSGRRWLALPGKTPAACTQLLNRALKAWSESAGLKPFTMYAARHSWASIARSRAVGVDKATVDDCLNHRSMALADIYIERDFDVFNDANERVLAIFEWESKNF